MPDLPAFTVEWNLFDIPGGVTAGKLTKQALAKARVLLTSNLGAVGFITFAGDSHTPPTLVYASVNEDGELIDRDGAPVKLLANDPGLSVSGIQWSASVVLPIPGPLHPITIGPWDAPVDGGLINLSSVVPVVALPPISDVVYIINGTPQ